MELFRNTNIDFLGKQVYFVALSVILVGASLFLLATRGLVYGIDFRGGADVELRFVQEPRIDEIRSALASQGFSGAQIQRVHLPEAPEAHDVLIRVPPQESGSEETPAEEADVSGLVLKALRSGLEGSQTNGKVDLNVAGIRELERVLSLAFPNQTSMATAAAQALVNYRESHSGLFKDMEEARNVPGVNPDIASWIRDNAIVGMFAIRSADYVGPSVGRELKTRATYAVIGSLVAMLIYIWFRFEKLAFGIAAIVTLAHDAIVSLGAMSLTGKEFDLTVLAAVLTVVGYSINDTIVIFDRVRENVRHQRGTKLTKLFNDSINQTLSRTVLTVFLVLLVVVTLWLFGGSRLNPFSFTLLVGVLSGTYSTIYVSSPIVIWWRTRIEKKSSA